MESGMEPPPPLEVPGGLSRTGGDGTRLRSPWRNSGRPGSVSCSSCWSPAWRSEKQKVDVQRRLFESLEESSPYGRPLVPEPMLNQVGAPRGGAPLSSFSAHPLEVGKDQLRWGGGTTPPGSRLAFGKPVSKVSSTVLSRILTCTRSTRISHSAPTVCRPGARP